MSRTPAWRSVLRGIWFFLVLAGCGEENARVVFAAPGDWEDPAGQRMRAGMELAAVEVNEEGGIGGRPLVLGFQQLDGMDVTGAVTLAQDMVARPEVVAVVGHTGSASAAGAFPVYQGRVPAVSPLATVPVPDVASPWVFRMASSPSDYASTVASFLEERGWSEVAILFDNTPRGRASAEALRSRVPGTDLFQPLYTQETVGSHEPIVEALAERNPDGVVLVTGAQNTAILLPMLRAELPGLPVVGDYSKTLSGRPEYRGVFVVMSDLVDSEGRVGDVGFRSRYRDMHGREPDPSAAQGYDAVRIVAEAARRSGASRRAIRRWLAERPDGPVTGGVTGPVVFDSTGVRAGRKLTVWQVCGDDVLRRPLACP